MKYRLAAVMAIMASLFLTSTASATVPTTLCHKVDQDTYIQKTVMPWGAYWHLKNHPEDIIEPFPFHEQTWSLNWDAEHRAIYDNGCVVPQSPSPSPSPSPSQSPSPSPSPSHSPSVTPSPSHTTSPSPSATSSSSSPPPTTISPSAAPTSSSSTPPPSIGESNDSSTPPGALPLTGGGSDTPLKVGAALLVGGMTALFVARRKAGRVG